jgi:aminoglycoside phosphotransferase (APT) family kinase protein
LHTMSPSRFGHEHMSDRAQILLWQRDTFNRLPRHVRALDAGSFQADGTPVSLGGPEEFFLLTEYAEGQGYFLDLDRIARTGALTELDIGRADALCDYLAEIHRVRGPDGGLYVRRIRELVGHGECIMGIADGYAANGFNPADELREIEHLCVDWRWRLKGRTHRLRQVHGDFHPWNILFGPGADFTVLDRSRGEFGDPADDVACLSLNYLFFSLERSGRLEGAFEILFRRFWARYLEMTSDREILDVVAPFFVFRALVIANPLWYPNLAETIRRQLFAFSLAVLRQVSFDPMEVNRYCGIES